MNAHINAELQVPASSHLSLKDHSPMGSRIYLDWNATAPLRPEAAAAMAAALQVGNPSSIHAEGRAARHLVETARRDIAGALGAAPDHLTFTSGGTEANALALAAQRADGQPVERLLISAIEHPSVLSGGLWPPDRVTRIPVEPNGLLDLDHLENLLAGSGNALLSVMLANNETGALQPLTSVRDLARKANALLHVDAVQALGKTDVNISDLQADLVTISGHKIGAPIGVGAICAGPRARLTAHLSGGGQEFGRRAGTENVAGIAAFGAAVKAAMGRQDEESARMAALQSRLETGLMLTPGMTIFSTSAPRLPNTTLFTVPGLRAETAVIGFDLAGIAVSSGSACSSGKVQPSHVLQAMGYPEAVARGGVRVSLGWTTTEAEIDRFLETWRSLAGALFKADETVFERF